MLFFTGSLWIWKCWCFYFSMKAGAIHLNSLIEQNSFIKIMRFLFKFSLIPDMCWWSENLLKHHITLIIFLCEGCLIYCSYCISFCLNWYVYMLAVSFMLSMIPKNSWHVLMGEHPFKHHIPFSFFLCSSLLSMIP